MAHSPARPGVFVLTALVALGLAGCSSGDKAGRKPVHPVAGKVLYKDKPAVGALVVFVPVNEPPEPVDPRPRGTVQEDGTFRLFTYEPDDGAPEGEYAVVITWPSDSQDEPGDKFFGRYADRNRPVARVTVQAGKNELEPFALK